MNIMNIILEAVNIPKYFPLRFLFSFAIYLKLIRLAMDAIRAEKKAKEAAELKRLLKLMHKKDISVEDLEAMISREA